LGHLDPPEPGVSVPLLLALLEDSDPLVRGRAAEGLSHFDEDADLILTRVRPALRDPDPLVRECAVMAVGRLAPHGTPLPDLRLAARDPDPHVRREAESALRRLTAIR